MLHLHSRQRTCLALLFQGVGLRDGGLVVVLEEREVHARAHGENVQQVKQRPDQIMVAAQVRQQRLGQPLALVQLRPLQPLLILNPVPCMDCLMLSFSVSAPVKQEVQ